MNLKTTLVLLVLTAGGGVMWWKGADWGLPIVPTTSNPSALTLSETQLALQAITPQQLHRIKVTMPDQEPVLLLKQAGNWVLPGNWPVRTPQVNELLATLSDLDSRFAPIALAEENPDLVAYGLNPQADPVEIRLELSRTDPPSRLIFQVGRPKPKPDQNPFTIPSYLRLTKWSDQTEEPLSEVLRLGPDTYDRLARPLDRYRSRRLFPSVASLPLTSEAPPTPPQFPGAPPQPGGPVTTTTELVGSSIERIGLRDGQRAFTLTRQTPYPKPVRPEGANSEPSIPIDSLAASWALTEPIRDQVTPERLRDLLAAVPEIWVEEFITRSDDVAQPLDEYGLDQPNRVITVGSRDGRSVQLLIGRRKSATQPPPPAPPLAQTTEPTFYYAKLADNPQVFTVRDDEFKNLFVALAELRDPQVVRIEPDAVDLLEIDSPGQPAVSLKQTGSKQQPRWDLQKPIQALAETAPVEELLTAINNLQTPPEAMIDLTEGLMAVAGGSKELYQQMLGFTPESPTIQLQRPSPIDPSKTQDITLQIGRQLTGVNKLLVKVKGWPRIDVVDDQIVRLIERPAIAYRGRRLFDVGEARIDKITVQQGKDETYTLKEKPGLTTTWMLTKPVQVAADTAKVSQLAGNLRDLEVTDYINDNPQPEDLTKYGLDKPRLEVTLNFSRAGIPAETLRIGKTQENGTGVYAQLQGQPNVFAIDQSVVDPLQRGSLDFRPLELWSVDQMTGLELQPSGKDASTLSNQAGSWKITAPFTAKVDASQMEPLTKALTSVQALRLQAHQAEDLAQYGLDAASRPARVAVQSEMAEPPALVVGNRVTEGSPDRFAKLAVADQPAIYVIGPDVAKAIDTNVLTLIDRQLLNLEFVEPQAITTQVKGSTTTLNRGRDGWKPAEEPQFPVDRLIIQRLIQTLSDLKAQRYAGYGQVDWGEYGLDPEAKPDQIHIEVGSAEKPQPHTVILGKPLEDGSRYARVDQQRGVAVLDATTVEDLAVDRLGFVDHRLLEFNPLDLTRLERQMGDQKLVMTLEGFNWQMTEPAKQLVDSLRVEVLTNELSRLRAERVAAYAPEEEKAYGLDTPAAIWTLSWNDEAGGMAGQKLKVGNLVDAKQPDGPRYAQVEDALVVGVLPAKLVKQLLAPELFFRDRKLAQFLSADRMVQEAGQRKLTFVKQPGGWRMTQPITDTAADAALREFHDAAAQLRAAEIVAEKPDDLKAYGLAMPSFRWHFYDGDQEVVDLLIGKQEPNGERVYAKLANGDLVVLLSPALSKSATAEYRARALWEPLDASQVNRLVIRTPEETINLTKGPAGWQDTQKPGDRFDQEAINQTLTTLANLQLERFVRDNDANLKLYGLEPPQQQLQVETPNRKVALQLGTLRDGTQTVYARLPQGRTGVFVLPADASTILRQQRSDYLEKSPKQPKP